MAFSSLSAAGGIPVRRLLRNDSVTLSYPKHPSAVKGVRRDFAREKERRKKLF